MVNNADKVCVVLAGQPNTGKSTIFSALTGMYQDVGNWPGKTVEKKLGKATHQNGDYIVIDLPGAYSLYEGSEEEQIAAEFLREQTANLVIIVASAVSPARTLSFATDILVQQIPCIIIFTMADVARDNDISFDTNGIEEALGIPTLLITATKSDDVKKLQKCIRETCMQNPHVISIASSLLKFIPDDVAVECTRCAEELSTTVPRDTAFASVWLALQGDKKAQQDIQEHTTGYTNLFTTKTQFLARKAAYDWAESVLAKKSTVSGTTRDDPAAGATSTSVDIPDNSFAEVPVNLSDDRKVARTVLWDSWLLHPFWGGLSLAIIMLLTLILGFGLGFPLSALVAVAFSLAEPFIASIGEGYALLTAMALGVWKGVGAVFTMLPFLAIFYAIFAILEDVGYMARTSVIMNRVMSVIGLDGKTFIPLLFAVPCNISGAIGTRILENPRQRMVALLLVPLVPCTAKIVVTVTLASWLFPPIQAFFIVLSLLFINLLVLCACSLLFCKIYKTKETSAGLLMELPHYHKPNYKTIRQNVWRNILGFIKKATTVIVSISVILWFLSNYPSTQIESSYLGQIGKFLDPVGELMGANWRLVTSLLASAVNKEAILATIGVLYDSSLADLPHVLQESVSKSSGIAFLVAQSLFITCVAALGVLHNEARSWKILVIIAVYSIILPFILASIVYHLLQLFY